MQKEGNKELSKTDFLQVMKDADIMIIPKVDEIKKKPGNAEEKKKDVEKEEEAKEPARKFDADDIKQAIMPCRAFDEENLGFVEFLEALVRIAACYPFTEEEQADMVNFEMRMGFFIDKLMMKYKNLSDSFQ